MQSRVGKKNEILVLQLKVAATAHLASDFMEITADWMLYPKARLLRSVSASQVDFVRTQVGY